MSINVRRMTEADIESAARVQAASFGDLSKREGEPPRELTDEVWQRLVTRHQHFVTHDPAGCWVAVDGETTVGCALALKRETLWGLSLLVVDPTVQSAGTGRRLLDAALTSAEGCDRAIILSSKDPRAMRSYATSGFALHPQVEANGEPSRDSLPASHHRVRAGSVADAAWADEVDRAVRGAPRGPDHVRLASQVEMFITDDVDGRGYAYVRGDGSVIAIAATDDDTATALLWRCFAHAIDLGVPIAVEHLNAAQQWAIATCYRARLKVAPSGPVFWRGRTPPLAYLPSGAYL
jgi:GNAT superfamily N-acetyltransferase